MNAYRFFVLFSLLVVVAGAGWIRIQSIPQLEGEYLFDTDSFRFYRQAEIIDQRGSLPDRDMERWLPIGRDLTTYLSFSSYTIAYATKFLRFFYPSLTIYQTALYYPVVIFLLTLPLVYLLAKRTCDGLTAFLSVLILAVLPSAVRRSAAGYADRDALCLFLGILSIYFYIRKEQPIPLFWQWIWNFLSSLAILLLGLTWEGAGIFVVILVVTELAKLMAGNYRKRDFYQYLFWFGFFLLGLMTLTRAYRVNANVSSPFAFPTLGVPFLFFLLALCYLVFKRRLIIVNFLTLSGRIPFEIALICMEGVFLGIISLAIVFQSGSSREFLLLLQSNFSSALGQSRLMESVGELQDVSFKLWIYRFGILYFLASIGVFLTLYNFFRQQRLNPWVFTASFGMIPVSVFYHQALNSKLVNDIIDAIIYNGSIAIFLGLIVLSRARVRHYQGGENRNIHGPSITLLCWFCVTLFLTRGANRYEFFLAPPAAILVAYTLSAISSWLSKHPRIERWRFVSWVVMSILILGLLILPVAGGYAFQGYFTAKQLFPLFASSSYKEAFVWMNRHLPPKAVMAANWDYGSHLNVLGKCATIIDEDHYIPYWIHLTLRHVFCAQSEREALEFLKTRGAAHLMFTTDDVTDASSISFIGSNEEYDRLFAIAPLNVERKHGYFRLTFVRSQTPRAPFNLYGLVYPAGSWEVETITIDLDKSQNKEHPMVKESQVQLKLRGKPFIMPLRRVFLQNQEYIADREKHQLTFPGGVILKRSSNNKDDKDWYGFYVSENGYESLLVKMFLLGKHSEHFKQVYPPLKGTLSDVKIWEIHYPKDIPFRPEYLRTDFDDKRLKMAWMFGKKP